uniref:Uncharacterized protein n=1 Tax=Glycine max TaxID=3847 RepID=A0A0R0K4G8_SOYBN
MGSTEAKTCWCMREEKKNAQDWKFDERERRNSWEREMPNRLDSCQEKTGGENWRMISLMTRKIICGKGWNMRGYLRI